MIRRGWESTLEKVDAVGKRREEENEGEEAKNRHHITNDALPYKRAATTSLRKWFVYYVVGLRSQANRR